MIKNFEFDYDESNDIMFLYDKKNKSDHSIQFGESIFFDVDKKNKVVAVELRNSRKLLGNFSGKKILAIDLKLVSKAKIQAEKTNGLHFFKLWLTIPRLQGDETIQATLVVPAANKAEKILA